MKAIIPAAGLGTRFMPIAKAVPKEMLPLGDKPVIHYVVAEAAAAGYDEILIIVSRGKESIIEYFSPNPALEEFLASNNKTAALQAVREVSTMARIDYTYQEKMCGLGDAVRLGRDFIGSDTVFAVLLGDTIMRHNSPLGAMTTAWKTLHQPSVCLEPCAKERVSRYGIAGGCETEPGIYQLDGLVEKPAPDQSPRLTSRDGTPLPFHAFAARYLLTPDIFDYLDKTHAGFGGEIQLTDAMEQLRKKSGMLGVTWPGKRLDIGNPAGLIEAAQAMGI